MISNKVKLALGQKLVFRGNRLQVVGENNKPVDIFSENPVPQKRKYNNKKPVVDGITFDSKAEAERYFELVILEKSGEISELKRQVKYVLIPEQREPDYTDKKGKVHKGRLLERECSYFADFTYKDHNGSLVVEDTKGMRTREYIIKRKLMLYKYGIIVKET